MAKKKNNENNHEANMASFRARAGLAPKVRPQEREGLSAPNRKTYLYVIYFRQAHSNWAGEVSYRANDVREAVEMFKADVRSMGRGFYDIVRITQDVTEQAPYLYCI